MSAREYTNPIYDIEVNGEVLLKSIEGEVSFDKSHTEKVLMDIQYHLLPTPGIRIVFSINNIELISCFSRFSDNSEPDVIIEGKNIEGVFISKKFNQNSNKNNLQCTFQPYSILLIEDTLDSANSIRFNLLNFPSFLCPGVPISDGHNILYKKDNISYRLGGVCLEYSDFTVHFHSLVNHEEIEDKLKQYGGYAITHVGTLEKLKSKKISFEETEKVLEIIHYFISFAAGRWCPPVLIAGLDDKDNIVWEKYNTPIDSRWTYTPNWFDKFNGHYLHEVFPGFVNKWFDTKWHETMRSAIYWYLLSNTLPSKDAGIILAYAALEILKNTYLLNNNKQALKRKYGGKFKIDSFLHELNIDTVIPSELTSINNLFGGDGPTLITEVRNSLVHPTNRVPTNWKVPFEAWNLTQWYLDLIFLNLCNYKGQYSNRITAGNHGQVENVPWV
ncbi:MAG: hypothetical protein P9X24_17440 [Candidatus Hatepunaea meridiana]|nr:hypothetical protein [Candidatus Hatepunaea meridiana]